MIRTIAVLMCLCALPALAQQSVADAAAGAATRLDAARDQLENAQSARDRVKALTETVRAYEDGLVAMRDGLRRADIRARIIEGDLAARRAEVGQLLGVMAGMGRAKGPLVLLHPSGALGTARSGMVAADVTPALQAKANALREQLEELTALRDLQKGAADILSDGLRGAQDARAALSVAIADRTNLPQRFNEDPVQTALLMAGAETLGDFATGLSQTFLNDVTAPAELTPSGDLPLPVQGQILRRFNAPDAAGVVRPGIIIAARPRALVTTPVPATVLFRGPLLDYGNVIIVEPAQGVLFVIAGLAEVFGEAGEVLPAGSPLGLLGGDTPAVDAILTQSAAPSAPTATQTLYLEVREGQSPVNPATWFVVQ